MRKKDIDEIGFSDAKIGRRLYKHSANGVGVNNQYKIGLHISTFDWRFPDKFCRSIGYTVHGFSFKFKYAPSIIASILNMTRYLINAESGIEYIENTLTDEIFYPIKKGIKEIIEEYNAIPTKKFINESYFLYDKSNLIKETFITAIINKQLSLYGSFSYFSGKTSISNLKLLTSSNFLKFLVKKKSLNSNLRLQLAQKDGSEVKKSDNKIHHFSITKL